MDRTTKVGEYKLDDLLFGKNSGILLMVETEIVKEAITSFSNLEMDWIF